MTLIVYSFIYFYRLIIMLQKLLSPLLSLYFQYQSFSMMQKKDKVSVQFTILYDILSKNSNCKYGLKYDFASITSYEDFISQVPLVKPEEIADYVDLCMQWNDNVVTMEEVIYFAQTAWTTTWRQKYIPVTKWCLSLNHLAWWREFMANYILHNPSSNVLQGKSLILWWWFFENPYTKKMNIGYISAILQKESGIIWSLFREPSEEIAYTHDRNTKINDIIETCKNQNITSMWWVTSRWLILLEELLKKTWKTDVLKVWPHFSLFISWWLNFEPYRNHFERFFPSQDVQFYQVYNASEWFFGVQYSNDNTDMLLLTNHGVFYEFIDMETYFSEHQVIVTLDFVQVKKRYALLITTYWGLYRYEIGDVVQFSDTDKLLFSIVWRTKVYIDVFSEHVIVDNTDKALQATCRLHNIDVLDYHVWPQFANSEWKWCHEWIIECDNLPENISEFIVHLDQFLKDNNSYYAWKRCWDLMMQLPVVHFVKKWTFLGWFTYKWKVWGQNKIPKLANDRAILEELIKISLQN